jgi:anti-sigma factor RsiW
MRIFGSFRCWVTRRQLTALADGELPRRTASRVVRHVEGCPACASFYAEIQGSVKIHRAVVRHLISASTQPDVTRMLRQVRARLADDAEPSRSWVWQPVAAVGVLVAAVLTLLFVVGDLEKIERKGARAPSVEGAQFAKEPARPGDTVGELAKAGTSAVQERPRVIPEQQQKLAVNDHLPRPTAETVVGTRHEQLPADPPAELLAKPDLFVQYGMMVRLDALENFDHVQSLPDDGRLSAKQPG